MPGQRNNTSDSNRRDDLHTKRRRHPNAPGIRGHITIENLGQFDRRLDGCSGELYGRLFPFHMSDPSWFVLEALPEHGHPGVAFQIRRMRIQHISSSFYLDVCWSPKRGWYSSIGGLELIPDQSNVMAAQEWARVMFTGRRRGRPVGTSGFRDRHHFLTVVCSIIRELRHQGRRPTQTAVVEILSRTPGCPGGDASQLRQRLCYYGLTWEGLLRHPLSIPSKDEILPK
jgi:hypothetical protein